MELQARMAIRQLEHGDVLSHRILGKNVSLSSHNVTVWWHRQQQRELPIRLSPERWPCSGHRDLTNKSESILSESDIDRTRDVRQCQLSLSFAKPYSRPLLCRTYRPVEARVFGPRGPIFGLLHLGRGRASESRGVWTYNCRQGLSTTCGGGSKLSKFPVQPIVVSS